MSDDLVKQSIAELQDIVHCDCAPAYLERGLHSHVCLHYMADAIKIITDRIEELEAEVTDMHEGLTTVYWSGYEDGKKAMEAKLAKVVEGLEKACTTLAKLTGEKA